MLNELMHIAPWVAAAIIFAAGAGTMALCIAIAIAIDERGSRYGKYHYYARTTQRIKRAMADSPNWTRLSATQREALDMIAHEIARILNGDPDYHDSWHALHRCAFHIEGLGHAGSEVRKTTTRRN